MELFNPDQSWTPVEEDSSPSAGTASHKGNWRPRMSDHLPIVYLARHGETAWSITGQHTGLTDLPLTEKGERNAAHLGDRLHGLSVAKVYTSPLQRASRTCELAGFGPMAEVDRDLVEWDYGQY